MNNEEDNNGEDGVEDGGEILIYIVCLEATRWMCGMIILCFLQDDPSYVERRLKRIPLKESIKRLVLYHYGDNVERVFRVHSSSLDEYVQTKMRLHEKNRQETALAWPSVIALARMECFFARWAVTYQTPYVGSRFYQPVPPLSAQFVRQGNVAGTETVVVIYGTGALYATESRMLVRGLIDMYDGAHTVSSSVHAASCFPPNAETTEYMQQCGNVPILSLHCHSHMLFDMYAPTFDQWFTDVCAGVWTSRDNDPYYELLSILSRDESVPRQNYTPVPCDMYTTVAVTHLIRTLCRTDRDFCGAQPCTLTRTLLTKALSHPYRCALKVDGERYLWLIHAGRIYAINRSLCVSQVAEHTRLNLLHDTVLDIEYVSRDKYHYRGDAVDRSVYDAHDPKKNTRGMVVILDALVFLGKRVMELNLIQRMNRVLWMLPYLQNDQLHVVPQEYLELQHASAMLASGRMYQYTSCDGMILVPVMLPYKAGYQEEFMKWKPMVQNTVDCMIEHDHEAGCTRLYTVGEQEYECIDTVRPVMSTVTSGGVYEMLYKAHVKQWVPVRERVDKCMPNASWVAQRIMSGNDSCEYLDREKLCNMLQQAVNGSKKIFSSMHR